MQTFIQELASKISNEYQWHIMLRKYGISTEYGTTTIGHKSYKKLWWAHREDIRMNYGIYELTQPLSTLNDLLPVYSHISLLDPQRVAFTPDKDSGERDKQVVINLGKMLTRYYPALRDEVIGDFVAQHESEISLEVEWIEHTDIAEAYTGIGTGACMSHNLSSYGGNNPADVYDVPGVRLAVLRGKDGGVTARSLVYEVSEKDKRYIRCYGDALLQKRLAKLGYVPGAFHGLKFKTTKLSGRNEYAGISYGSNSYVLPYIDGNGSVGNAHVSYVALIDNVLTSVTTEYANKLLRLMPQCAVIATSTCGYTTINNVDSSTFSVPDCISGKSISRFDKHDKYLIDGIERISAEDLPGEYSETRVYIGETSQYRYMLKSASILHDYRRYDLSTLSRFNIVQLDVELYPEKAYEYKTHAVTTESGKLIRKSDSISVIIDDSHTQVAHNSEIQKTGRGKHIKLGTSHWALPTVKLYVTPGGRKIHPLSHSVVKMYDGMYEFTRNLKTVTVLGKDIWVPKVNTPKHYEGSAIYKDRLADVLDEARKYSARQMQGISLFSRHLYESLTGGSSFNSSNYYDRRKLDASQPVAVELETIKYIAKNCYHVPGAIVVYAASVMLAEMQAVEAPHYLSEEAVEVPPTAVVVPSDDATLYEFVDGLMSALDVVSSVTPPLVQEAFGISNALTWQATGTSTTLPQALRTFTTAY